MQTLKQREDTMLNQLKTVLETVQEWTIDKRRHLHSIPEIGFKEEKTSAYITQTLTELGYTPRTGIAKTGVTTLLETGRKGPTIMLRADMDGLRMTEETHLPFASTHQGFAHACGHDLHVAMLLGAAKVLQQCKDSLSGNILFVFQPAEEGLGGAQVMIDEGIMDAHNIDFVFGQHVWPALPLGTIGVREGSLMAAVNHFTITIHGKGGHGAMPHECVDALEVGTQVVNALQRIVSRHINPLEPIVVTIGSFHAGTAFNIIPEKAVLTGTTRTFNHEIWTTWPDRLYAIIDGVCSSMGARFELEIDSGYPPLSNDPTASAIAHASAQKVERAEAVVEPQPTMCAEDMSFFHEKAKGAFIFLGCGQPHGAPLHSPQFNCPEEVLSIGVELHCRLAFEVLATQPEKNWLDI